MTAEILRVMEIAVRRGLQPKDGPTDHAWVIALGDKDLVEQHLRCRVSLVRRRVKPVLGASEIEDAVPARAKNAACVPQIAISSPATDAASTRMSCMLPVDNAIAFITRCEGTMLGITARRGAWSNDIVMPLSTAKM